MSCKNTMIEVEKLVYNEYLMASEQHGRTFSSRHEGESVIREEIEETGEGIFEIRMAHQNFWNRIRRDVSAKLASEDIADLYHAAVETATEAIQVAAMAMKMLATLEKEKEDEDGKD